MLTFHSYMEKGKRKGKKKERKDLRKRGKVKKKKKKYLSLWEIKFVCDVSLVSLVLLHSLGLPIICLALIEVASHLHFHFIILSYSSSSIFIFISLSFPIHHNPSSLSYSFHHPFPFTKTLKKSFWFVNAWSFKSGDWDDRQAYGIWISIGGIEWNTNP